MKKYRFSILLLCLVFILAACSPALADPLYPGAKLNQSAGLNKLSAACIQQILIHLKNPKSDVSIETETYTTTDAADTIKAWYQQRLSGWTASTTCDTITVFRYPQGCSSTTTLCTRLVVLGKESSGLSWVAFSRPK